MQLTGQIGTKSLWEANAKAQGTFVAIPHTNQGEGLGRSVGIQAKPRLKAKLLG